MKLLNRETNQTQAGQKQAIPSDRPFGKTAPLAISLFVLAPLLSQLGCTGQLPGSFRFLQQEQTFKTSQDVNTKIDLLWVVDNSSSMDVHQQKLRNGFQAFATKYLQPTWDIRVAVITTDTYLANPAFSTYLNTYWPTATPGIVSSYLSKLSWLSSYKNPSWNPTLVNTKNGSLTNGIKYGEFNPLWGPYYALLKAGIHDGPITAFCMEAMPYFLLGVTQCSIRDNPSNGTGPDGCIAPDTASGQSSLSQCVNTIQNDTVRSGKAIIETVPPAGTLPDSAWTTQLGKDFMVNSSVGSSGAGSERGLASLLQMVADNEPTSTAFFRKGSLRGIIFLTDEDDQSLEIPSTIPAGYSPDEGYACNLSSLLANNGNSKKINGSGGYCCSSGCKYGSLGTTCDSKTVDGYTYTLDLCAKKDQLISVSSVKSKLDSFFLSLDGSSATDPNYFIATITPATGDSIKTIQSSRKTEAVTGTIKSVEADRGDRYIELGNQVGGGSLVLDISSSDYGPVLDAIGKAIVAKKSSFTLDRAPTGQEDMIITIIHQDGTTYVVPNTQYTISGKVVTFTDQAFVLSLALTDKVSINYQPKTAY